MALFRRILSLARPARLEHEIDAELREPIAMCTDDNIAQGMSPEEAERDARIRFERSWKWQELRATKVLRPAVYCSGFLASKA